MTNVPMPLFHPIIIICIIVIVKEVTNLKLYFVKVFESFETHKLLSGCHDNFT